MRLLRFVLVAAAFAAATFAIGWWGVPLVGAAMGVITSRERGGATVAALAAMVAWGALLLWDAARGPLGHLASVLAGVLTIRPVGVYAVTLCFAGLLALTSALVARGVAGLARTPAP
ncbi:MAG: hypothetical protein HY084_08575 [Gemmatimonadetes bacterium]|nr:hypothetical protein [Gemmatimonadota bacterium]